MQNGCFDVAIIGAGPAGATCAYYLARQGRSVLLLERAVFPRDKICGDAVVPRAQKHLERMGLLPALLDQGAAQPAYVGGFITPRGTQVVGDSQGRTVRTVLAIRRRILDESVARAAERAGAVLREGQAVTSMQRDDRNERWSIFCADGASHSARMLVAADGANSQTARRLGLVRQRPRAVCSRAYIAPKTHRFEMDGVCFYENDLLPGYAAVFRETEEELNFCCYILPGGPTLPRDLRRMHTRFLESDPRFRSLVGSNVEVERMRSAPLRLGGIRKSYAAGLLVVGDAAGHIDPLTGEGIQYGMDAAEIAAETIEEALAANDLSQRFLKRYHRRWMSSFGWDFYWSLKMTQVLTRHPGLLEASAAAINRLGGDAFAEWGDLMTGEKPKLNFLRPRIVLPILRELVCA